MNADSGAHFSKRKAALAADRTKVHAWKLAAAAIRRQGYIANLPLDRARKHVQHPHMELFLREWRLSLDLTLEAAASQIGVHLTTLQKWEKGLRDLGTADLQKIARAYAIDEIALYFHPDDRAQADRAKRALAILQQMQPDTAEQWLRLAETLAPAHEGEKKVTEPTD